MTRLGRAVHLLPAGEAFLQGYPSTSVAVCGEPVTGGPDGDEVDLRYCADCSRAVMQRTARPGAVVSAVAEIRVSERVPGERARIVVQGQCSDDGSTATLVIIQEENGSWSIHGLGVTGVMLSKADMTAVAESILGRFG